MIPKIPIDKKQIENFCRQNHIKRLALFGSVLRDDFGPDSDVDVLIEFEPEKTVGFIRLGQMEEELSQLFQGRALDLVTPKFLNKRIKNRILSQAQNLHSD